MFYCDPCRKKKDWPERAFKSTGPCEVCGKVSACNDVPSKDLGKDLLIAVPGKWCPRCKDIKVFHFTPDEVSALVSGELIQVALSTLSPDDRERFISGYCPPCYNLLLRDD